MPLYIVRPTGLRLRHRLKFLAVFTVSINFNVARRLTWRNVMAFSDWNQQNSNE